MEENHVRRWHCKKCNQEHIGPCPHAKDEPPKKQPLTADEIELLAKQYGTTTTF